MASGGNVSGTSDDVSEDEAINDSSSHKTKRRPHNTTSETYNPGSNNFTRNDPSKNTTHNVHAETINHINGAKNVNTGANYGVINQNDYLGAMPSREPYALQFYNYQRSGGQGSPRPPTHHAYSDHPAGHYYNEQEHYNNDTERPPYGRPRGDPRYQDRAPYWPPPEGSYRYPVNPRDGGSPSGAMGDTYLGNDTFSAIYERDEGEKFNPHYPLPADGYPPVSHPRGTSDVVASATTNPYATPRSGPPPMKSKNPFRKAAS